MNSTRSMSSLYPTSRWVPFRIDGARSLPDRPSSNSNNSASAGRVSVRSKWRVFFPFATNRCVTPSRTCSASWPARGFLFAD